MLSEEEQAALERMRIGINSYGGQCEELYLPQSYFEDLFLAEQMLLRLYPPGWNDPVTPERLVELGGVELRHDGPPQLRVVNFASGASVDFYNGDVDSVDIGSQTEFVMLHSCMFPRNMKEARELLERFGVEVAR